MCCIYSDHQKHIGYMLGVAEQCNTASFFYSQINHFSLIQVPKTSPFENISFDQYTLSSAGRWKLENVQSFT